MNRYTHQSKDLFVALIGPTARVSHSPSGMALQSHQRFNGTAGYA